MSQWKTYQATISGKDVHHDVPLGNFAVRAFQSAEEYVAPRLVPPVRVEHETDRYYIIDPNTWLVTANDLRGRREAPRQIEWKVSSDAYAVQHRVLRGGLAKEDIANADAAIRLRQNTARHVSEALARTFEDRVASFVTSISNVGSGVSLAGGDKWSDLLNSDPISAVNTGHAFSENRVGLHLNTMVIDKDTYRIARRHPMILDQLGIKFTTGGFATDAQLKEAFEVENLWVARGIVNRNPGGTSSIVNIWGNNVLLAYVDPNPQGVEVTTFMVGFRWQPEDFPAPFQAVTYDDPDPGRRTEYVEVGYFQDEKRVARDLSYLIAATL